MKKILYFTMSSCVPCKIVGPKIKDICFRAKVPLEEIDIGTWEGKNVANCFRVFMSPEIVVLDNYDSSKPLDQQNATITNIEAAKLPHTLENMLLNEANNGKDNDGKDKRDASPELPNNNDNEDNPFVPLLKLALALYCVKKIKDGSN